VRVEFEVPARQFCQRKLARTVVTIPPSVITEKSSQEQYGWAKDDYLFYSSDRVRTLLDSALADSSGESSMPEESSASGKRKYEEFFVGTEQQYKIS